MLTEVFYWLFSMSVVAGLTGLVVLLLRCVRGIPRRLICWMWCVPFLRMWIPVGIGSRFSFLLPLLHLGIRSVPAWDTTMVNCAAGAESYFPIAFKSEVLELIFRISAVLLFRPLSPLALAPIDLIVILSAGGITAGVLAAISRRSQT
ncbi:MAG: hypothetical protein PUB93_04360 [Firmicutes bacterium]|nr:hypothetical protein [Bacillota bacterium]